MDSNNDNDDLLWAHLVCLICKKTLREPRTLTCMHSFCYSCLKTHFDDAGFSNLYGWIKHFKINIR